MSSRLALVLVLVLALVPGCGRDEELANAPGDLDASASDAATPDADTDAPIEAGAKIRTVQRRNPFGNTAASDNLMVDGDFEWTSGFGQHGWRAMDQGGGEAGLSRETGGLCHSGVSCGVLRASQALIGLATAPRNKQMLITVYAKPPEPDCALTAVSLISCTSAAVFNLAVVPPVSATPGADGWCQHRAIGPVLDEQPCLYILGFISGEQRTLIDNASIVAADGTGASPLGPTAPSAELSARVERDVRWLNDHRLFGRWSNDAP